MHIIQAFSLTAAALLALPASTTPGAPGLRVVATTPDLAALARAIGGDRVAVTALAKPTEDAHFVDPKPSFLIALNRADALIEGGAELELGWLPPLLDNARNARIASGAPGRIVAAQGIVMLEVPATFDRAHGDVHSMGNPHFLIDPVNVRIVAARIAGHFAQLDPASAGLFRANLEQFNHTLDTKYAEWRSRLAPYRGARIVTYHKDFVYLAERFGLEIVETLEPKPGIAPSSAHLAQVISTMRAQHARVIIVQPYQNRRTAETVARQTDGMVLIISQQPGAIPNTASYFELMDHIVATLASALESAR